MTFGPRIVLTQGGEYNPRKQAEEQNRDTAPRLSQQNSVLVYVGTISQRMTNIFCMTVQPSPPLPANTGVIRGFDFILCYYRYL